MKVLSLVGNNLEEVDTVLVAQGNSVTLTGDATGTDTFDAGGDVSVVVTVVGGNADTLDSLDSTYFQQALADVGSIEINSGGSGDRNTFLDLHSDDTNTDYSARIIRWAGVNGDFDILNLGTGLFNLVGNVKINSFEPVVQGSSVTLTGDVTGTANFDAGGDVSRPYVHYATCGGGDGAAQNPPPHLTLRVPPRAC